MNESCSTQSVVKYTSFTWHVPELPALESLALHLREHGTL
jgi:hypothetical protein